MAKPYTSSATVKARAAGSSFSGRTRAAVNITVGTHDEYEGAYTVTPDETGTVLATNNKRMTDDVTFNAIPSDYVGSAIDRRDETDLTVSGPTVTVPEGYYADTETATVQSGSAATPATSITANPTITFASGTGYIEANVTASQSVTPAVSEGYVTSGAAGTVSVSGTANRTLPTQSGTTITPTESVQTAVDAYKWTTGDVKVDAIPSDYVGSGITQRTSSDLTASGATVTAPGGYYASDATKTIPNAEWLVATTVGTNPTISVDSSTGEITASYNRNVNLSPIVTSGYAADSTTYSVNVNGTKTSQLSTQAATTITPTTSSQTAVAAGKYTTGAVTVDPIPSQYIVPSGTLEVTANGTGIDCSEYAAVDVAVPGSSPTLETVTKTYTPSTSQQTETITPSIGYDGIGEVDVTVNAVSDASYTLGLDERTAVVGSDTYWRVKPKINVSAAGHVASGEVVGTGGSAYPYLAATTVTPTESQQTVGASGTYMGGAVTVDAISSTYVGSGITRRSSLDMSASGATVTAPAGYYASAGTKTVSSGSATAPASISGTGATVSHSGTTLTLSKTVSVTPSVSAGYVSSGTAGNSAVSLSATDANFVAANIKSGVSLFGLAGAFAGKEFETGTYTPSSNAARPTINFAKTHSTLPIIVIMTDAKGTEDTTTYTNYVFVYVDWEKINGATVPYGSGDNRYGGAFSIYRANSTSVTVNCVYFKYSSDNTGSADNTYPRYFVTTSSFKPYSSNTNRYWRTTRTYKWIALWN